MTRSRMLVAVTAVASIAGLFGYLMLDPQKPVVHRRAPVTALADPDPDPEPRAEPDPATTQARLVAPTPAPTAATAPALDERSIMAALRALGPEDATRVLELARDGNARFPNSPDAAERSWTIAKALVNLGRFLEARDEARLTVQRYPGTTWAQDVERHLLINPLDLPSREEQQELDRVEKEIDDSRGTLGAQ